MRLPALLRLEEPTLLQSHLGCLCRILSRLCQYLPFLQGWSGGWGRGKTRLRVQLSTWRLGLRDPDAGHTKRREKGPRNTFIRAGVLKETGQEGQVPTDA